jgi:hypothetical protein
MPTTAVAGRRRDREHRTAFFATCLLTGREPLQLELIEYEPSRMRALHTLLLLCAGLLVSVAALADTVRVSEANRDVATLPRASAALDIGVAWAAW